MIEAVVEMKQRNPRFGYPRIAQQINLAFGLDLDKDTVRRVLDIEAIRSLPHETMSHPFVERLIGSIRRELLDQAFFWTVTDLENKLRDYQRYYNEHRCHSSQHGVTPDSSGNDKVVDLTNYLWDRHCRGLFQLPVAA
ncbi:hypothetical protein DWB85_07025 [Seongchinamella sediminis]|uniref:Integrase catalytic domain-containing protein n=1 Tax=Seongchinamella sediminis TaxID=2283635 RepID=A0A3L7E0P9_9GAMM|nr:integrase core domain-containing protein [Seongchinamella sediminis]RLQ22370.1 hypothetical protein DWB85_07025 [Seongchinamella sediminis]